jgi:hypothetical protein
MRDDFAASIGQPARYRAQDAAGKALGQQVRLVGADQLQESIDEIDPELHALADVSRLITMDHTHCFTCGSDLDASVANIETVKDPRVFGLFPAFRPFADKAVVQATCDRLREMTADVAQEVVASVPEAWEVSAGARIALRDFIVQRAGFVADNMIDWLGPVCWPQAELDLM